MDSARAVIGFLALAGLAVGLQAAVIAWPGPAGQVTALLGSLPVAVAARLYPGLAPWFGAAVAGALAAVRPGAAVEFALITGPLGLVAGYGARDGRPAGATVARAGLTLAAGVLVLATVAARPAPAAGLAGLGPLGGAAVYLGCGLVCARAGQAVASALRRPGPGGSG